jgi:hypothetical protein
MAMLMTHDPFRKSRLRHPGHAQAPSDTPAAGMKRRSTAIWISFEATDSERWIKGKSCFRRSSCLIQLPEKRQRSGEVEKRYGVIWVAAIETNLDGGRRL